MIKLNVKPYCENCPDFEPDVYKNEETLTFEDPIGYSMDFDLGPKIKIIHKCDTTVMCKNRNRCSCIMEHLKDKKDKESKQ